eukprot:566950-Lingulodinium_polyedra.AAC.1
MTRRSMGETSGFPQHPIDLSPGPAKSTVGAKAASVSSKQRLRWVLTPVRNGLVVIDEDDPDVQMPLVPEARVRYGMPLQNKYNG